jgi:hypothetical protein
MKVDDNGEVIELYEEVRHSADVEQYQLASDVYGTEG